MSIQKYSSKEILSAIIGILTFCFTALFFHFNALSQIKEESRNYTDDRINELRIETSAKLDNISAMLRELSTNVIKLNTINDIEQRSK